MLLEILVLPVLRGATPDLLYAFPLSVIGLGWWMHGSFWVGLKSYLIIYCFFSYVIMR